MTEMSLDGLRVNHAGLDTAAEDMGRTVKDIDDRLNRLEQELAPLRSDWSGSAQQAYTTAKAKWDGAIQDMRNLLEETSKTVYQSNAEYKAADQRGAASFDI
ncbi:WXG100 family type VII secretion target [Nocardioides ginsengisegetis]|uniref:ESAT-6-like protein n=2 Tax=Nocardioides ginsengisegetis TaxID=661491 RepID=A0A7W3J2X5_9ACTN|nr:WXG100 family type VII secretion target [Nocardioides ginsengisegetis]